MTVKFSGKANSPKHSNIWFSTTPWTSSIRILWIRIGAERTMQRSVRSNVSPGCKNPSRPRLLLLLPRSCNSRWKRSQGGPFWVTSYGQAEANVFLPIPFWWGVRPLAEQRWRSTLDVSKRRRTRQAEPRSDTLRRKRSDHNSNKFMNAKIVRSSGGSSEYLASPSPPTFDHTVSNTPRTGYSSLREFEAKINEEWLAYIRKGTQLCPGGTSDRYDAVSPFLKAARRPWGYQSYLIQKKSDVSFLLRVIWL